MAWESAPQTRTIDDQWLSVYRIHTLSPDNAAVFMCVYPGGSAESQLLPQNLLALIRFYLLVSNFDGKGAVGRPQKIGLIKEPGE